MKAQTVLLEPNETPWPSALWNNPELAPLLDTRQGERLSLGSVPEETAIGSLLDDTIYTNQGPNADLASLRLQFPFLQIIPFPPRAVSVKLTVASQAYNIDIPDGTSLIKMKGNGDYYVSQNGNAEVPFETPGGSIQSQSIYKPEEYLLYVGGIRQLSVISPFANTIVTVLCFMNPKMQFR